MKRYPANFTELVYLTEGSTIDAAKLAARKAVTAVRPANLMTAAGKLAGKAPGLIAKAAGAGINAASSIASGSAGKTLQSIRAGGVGGLLGYVGAGLAAGGQAYIDL